MLNKIKKVLKNPWHLVVAFSDRGWLNPLSDKMYLKLMYRARLGKKLNLENPKTFNEKLQWLKLYNRKPEFTIMVDKYEVKKYVADLIGDEYVIPTLGVWDRFEDIDFDTLPNSFVLKCTHDSGGLVICKDKSQLDLAAAKSKIERSLKRNYYKYGREWPYKNVKPRIIAEEYMEDVNSKESLNVYKIMTFSGEPKIIQTIQNDKKSNETIDYFDTNWNLLDLRQNFPNSEIKLSKPEKLEEMLSLARLMGEGFSFLRIDFYEVNGKVYFSEFTFYSDSGTAKFNPCEWDEKLGDYIKLPSR